MAFTAVYIGPKTVFRHLGMAFYQGQERSIPDDAAEALSAHPWFTVEGEAVPTSAEAAPRRRGRPRKEA